MKHGTYYYYFLIFGSFISEFHNNNFINDGERKINKKYCLKICFKFYKYIDHFKNERLFILYSGIWMNEESPKIYQEF